MCGNQWSTHLIRSCSTVKRTSSRGRVLPAGATRHDLVAAFKSLLARAFICTNSLFYNDRLAHRVSCSDDDDVRGAGAVFSSRGGGRSSRRRHTGSTRDDSLIRQIKVCSCVLVSSRCVRRSPRQPHDPRPHSPKRNLASSSTRDASPN